MARRNNWERWRWKVTPEQAIRLVQQRVFKGWLEGTLPSRDVLRGATWHTTLFVGAWEIVLTTEDAAGEPEVLVRATVSRGFARVQLHDIDAVKRRIAGASRRRDAVSLERLGRTGGPMAYAALAALVRCRTQESDAAIRYLLEAPVPVETRVALIEALGRHGDLSAELFLRAILAAEERELHESASDALRVLERRAR